MLRRGANGRTVQWISLLFCRESGHNTGSVLFIYNVDPRPDRTGHNHWPYDPLTRWPMTRLQLCLVMPSPGQTGSKASSAITLLAGWGITFSTCQFVLPSMRLLTVRLSVTVLCNSCAPTWFLIVTVTEIVTEKHESSFIMVYEHNDCGIEYSRAL